MLFELREAIYKKEDISGFLPDVQICLTLTKLFGLDLTESQKVKKLIPYLFHLNPQHYVYLLYYQISKKKTIPYVKIPKKLSDDKSDLYLEAQKILGWSDREVYRNHKILSSVLEDEKYWNKEFGL